MTIKNQKGASAVEFAFIAPLLFVLLFGIIEFGILIYNKAMVTNASREGARAGIVYRDPALLQTGLDTLVTSTVTNYTSTYLISFDGNKTPVVPSPIWGDINGNTIIDAGDSLTVTVNYNYSLLIFPNLVKLVQGSFSKTINLSAVTVMRFE